MPKYSEDKVAGYFLYFTSHCIVELMHVHASDKRLTEAGSAKLWVKDNGDIVVANMGQLNSVELGKIAKYIKLNISTMRKKWDDFKGYAK